MRLALTALLTFMCVFIPISMFVFVLIGTPEDIQQAPSCMCPDFSNLDVGESETIRRRGINYTYVNESFHNYIIVEGKRVIHPHDCKCKTNK